MIKEPNYSAPFFMPYLSSNRRRDFLMDVDATQRAWLRQWHDILDEHFGADPHQPIAELEIGSKYYAMLDDEGPVLFVATE